MIKKMGFALLAMFAIEIAGCAWFWNQEPACPQGYDQNVQGCKGMPPLPPQVGAPDAATDTSTSDSDSHE